MSRTLSPAEHQQRVDAARARWRDHRNQAGAAAAAGAAVAIGAEAARRHVAREGAAVIARQVRDAAEPAAQAAYAASSRASLRAGAVDRMSARAARQARSSWPFERVYQQLGRDSRLDRAKATDLDTGRAGADPDWAKEDAQALRNKASRAESTRAAVAPYRSKRNALRVGATWTRQAERWTSKRKVKVDPLKSSPELKADYDRRLAYLTKPRALGGEGQTVKQAEKQLRGMGAYRFKTETKTVIHHGSTGAQGARRGSKMKTWPKTVDRSTAEAVGQRAALRYSPQGRASEVVAALRGRAASLQGTGDAVRAAGATAARAVLAAAPKRLQVGAAVGIAAAGAAAGAGLYAAGQWGRAKLQKADNPEDRTQASLGAAFRSWLQTPRDAGDPAALEAAAAALKDAFESAAGKALPPAVTIGGSGGAPRRRLVFDLDLRSPDIERQAQQHAAAMVTRISREARDAIRAVIVRGTQEGLDIPTQARLIRESIGLTAQQSSWVQNYRAELEAGYFARAQGRVLRDRRYDRVLDKGEPLSAEQVEKMVGAYHRRILAHRATTIARTEAVGASNIGRLAGTRAYLEANTDVTVIKTWHATDDERTRDDHVALNGREVTGLDTPFLVTPKDGSEPYEIRFPHDPLAPVHSVISCRCTWSVRVVRTGTPSRLTAEAVSPPDQE